MVPLASSLYLLTTLCPEAPWNLLLSPLLPTPHIYWPCSLPPQLLCQGYPSGHLGSLLNEAEAAFVATMIVENGVGQSPVWIGLHDPNKNRRWKWSSNALYLYQAWEKGFPGRTDPNYCVSLTPESGFQRWKDEPCQKKNLYLCKFKA
ncbi:lithostathine-1-alpha-like isoform X2 [Sarcophilus harrisii]|uniref:lithostathine-1-alpha-like isoform X2 n=1 Tax=Sarcophilus harrisii TaxID=9305 RepID=UPI001301CECE|nr:lithostathine-1-alpha-like isoform X2 [Sarcophilus harrisii]